MPRGKKSPDGEEYIAANGYKYRKVDGKWRLLHHVIAEEQILGRPLLPSESVRFKSPDKLDLRADNLEVVVKHIGTLQKRKARLEAQIEELQAQLADVNEQIAVQAKASERVSLDL
jgi:septal ring factor EnvC (AmiA/AmiB activator)